MRLLAGWLPALRIARREALRAKGRTLLVLAMILVPVGGLTFAAVMYDMFRLTPAESIDRRIGRFDAQLTWQMRSPVKQEPAGLEWAPAGEGDDKDFRPTDADLLRLLPPGSSVVRSNEDVANVRTRTGVAGLTARHLDLRDGRLAPMVSLTAGTAPTGDGQVALSAQAAKRIGVGIGGTVQLSDGSKRFTVTGLVEFPAALSPILVFPPGTPGPGDSRGQWLVDTPGPLDWAAVRRLNEHGVVAVSRAVVLRPPPASDVDYPPRAAAKPYPLEALVLGLGVLEIVLLAGPAFAVSARRRRRDLALVAANGGTPAHLRRIVLADGVVLGLAGAICGIAAGILIAFAGRPLAEEYLIMSRAGGYRVFPAALLAIACLAVLTGVLAALVPAFTAARQDIVASLAGRRGAVRSRKRWIVTGLVLLGCGVAAALAGVLLVSSAALTGGLVVAEFGLVLCTPALIGLLARVGGYLPLPARIALRDTSRNRASAAPAISAVMAAVAASVMAGVFLNATDERDNRSYARVMPHGYVALVADPDYPQSSPRVTAKPVRVPAAELDRLARRVLPVTGTTPVFRAICPPGSAADAYCNVVPEPPADRQCPVQAEGQPTKARQRAMRADPRCNDTPKAITTGSTSLVVDDGGGLGLISGATGDDLTRARAVLAAGGVVVTDRKLVEDGKVTVAVTRYENGKEAEPVRFQVPAYVPTSAASQQLTVLSPAVARQAGLAVEEFGIVAATSRLPSEAQLDALRAAVQNLQAPYSAEVERPPNFNDRLAILLLAAVAALVALGAAAIATGLSAVDGRPDLATLAAVGASPGLRRRLSLSQSGVIAGLGSLLGAAAGIGAGVALIASINRGHLTQWPINPDYPVVMPWLSLLIAVVVVPVVAMLGAGLLTRSRLPIERRL